MAFPTIIVDNSGVGSDVAASGAGPAAALTGTAAATNGTGLLVTLDGSPDLTNVAADGTHALWLNTATGRQFGSIVARDNTAKTVSVSQGYAGNLTGQAWAIGGRRATIAGSSKLFAADLLAGWTVDVQETGTDYVLTGVLQLVGQSGTAAAPIAITSSSAGRPTIRQTTAGANLFDLNANKFWRWSHLGFRHAGTTRGHGFRAAGNNSQFLTWTDCVFDGFASAILADNAAVFLIHDLYLDNCLFRNGTADAVVNQGAITAQDCTFLDNAGAGLLSNQFYPVVALECTFARNGRGIYCTYSGQPGTYFVRRCLFHANANSGFELGAAGNANATQVLLDDCVAWGNGAFGVRLVAQAATGVNRRNAYGANTSGARSGLAVGAGDITLTADPCVNAAGNDFRWNAAAGGGASLKAIPRTLGTLSPSSYPDLGPYQSAGGASVPPPPLQPGTFAYYG
jgi:hypothetical protein